MLKSDWTTDAEYVANWLERLLEFNVPFPYKYVAN